MRIGIFTQPLKQNYGGLLQNFALQSILKKLGHEVITLDNDNWRAPILSRIYNRILEILRIKTYQPDVFSNFVKNYIVKTSGAPVTGRQLKYAFRKLHPEVMIVGSDQVWRPKYCYDIRLSFLSFANCKKIAYAVSFGVKNWEYSENETIDCSKLLKDFSAVGVREATAVKLCSEYLKCKIAEPVLDPTLLLDKSSYPASNSHIHSRPYLFTYILDWSVFKGDVISKFAQIRNLDEVHSSYHSKGRKKKTSLSPEEWLAGIKNAKFVICDSFHGIAFSIIYNIDFIALLNPERGNTRIESILELFDLSNRIVTSVEDLEKINCIDWEEVNSKRQILINHSIDFLKKALDYDNE